MAFGKKRELRTHWQRIDAAGLPPELMRRLSPGLGAQQERIIDCFAKSHGGLDIAPEKRNDDLIVNDPSLAIGQRSIGSESEADNIVVIVENRNVIEKDNWGVGYIYNGWNGGNVGLVGHDGISRYYDETQDCWLPIRPCTH
jgi:hypothetical protein